MLNCSVTLTDSDQGPLEYTWTKDGEPIEDHIQLQNNGSLYFRRVIHKPRRNKTDMGFYECYVKNKIGSIIARRVNVDIASMSKSFIQEPQPQRVSVGAVARFQCQINAVPSALYVWEKDRTALPQDNVRFIVLSSGILQIINVQESDAGQYRCIATQGALHELPDEVLAIHRRDSSEAALEVSSDSGTKQLHIIAGPGNVTALVGSTVILECLIEGAALSIQWERKDGVIRSDGHVTKVGNNLKFVEVKFEDSGEYTCHGIGENLTRVVSTGNLLVYRPPVSKEDPSSVQYPPAKWARFKCSVEGTPKPIIIWLKDGKKLKPDGRIRFDGNDLVITVSNPSDSGYYQCIAENKVGFTSVFARFFVRKPSQAPTAPEDLDAEDVGSTEMKLVWKQAMTKSSSSIVAYSVHYQAEGDSNALNVVVRETEVMLNNLSPYTNYSIYVLSYASTGAGPKSSTIIIQTKEDFPRKAPNIKLIGEPGKIQVEWEEIPRKDRNGLIVKYQIHYREMGLPDTLKVEDNIPPTVQSHTITGLKTDTEYEVRMLAATSIGYPTLTEKNWPWIKVRTTASSSTVQPPFMQVFIINSTTVNITWKYMGDEAEVESYNIYMRNLKYGNSTTIITILAPAQRFILSSLDTNTNYEVALTAKTSKGYSSPVVEEFQTSDNPIPPAPVNLEVHLLSPSSANLTWEQPHFIDEIVYYIVRYQELVPNGATGEEKYQRSDKTSALIVGLKPNTSYHFAVQAHSQQTRGKFSEPITQTTKEDVPSEPLNVRIHFLAPQKVQVEWSPPASPNGNITGYIIMHTTSPTNEWKILKTNGSVTSVTIPIITADVIYLRLQAYSQAGQGLLSNIVKVQPPKDEPNTENLDISKDPKLGIVVGVTIAVVCIIICIIIVLFRNRCFTSNYMYDQTQTQPARFHGNGHGNGHAVTPGDDYESPAFQMELYTPVLTSLPENEHADSKGGGAETVVLTPNGAKLNGFVPLKKNGLRNGHLPNGHLAYVSAHYGTEELDPEETRGLIAAMLAATEGSRCITGGSGDDSFTPRHEEMGSLDDIDHSLEGSDLDVQGGSACDAASISDCDKLSSTPLYTTLTLHQDSSESSSRGMDVEGHLSSYLNGSHNSDCCSSSDHPLHGENCGVEDRSTGSEDGQSQSEWDVARLEVGDRVGKLLLSQQQPLLSGSSQNPEMISLPQSNKSSDRLPLSSSLPHNMSENSSSALDDSSNLVPQKGQSGSTSAFQLQPATSVSTQAFSTHSPGQNNVAAPAVEDVHGSMSSSNSHIMGVKTQAIACSPTPTPIPPPPYSSGCSIPWMRDFNNSSQGAQSLYTGEELSPSAPPPPLEVHGDAAPTQIPQDILKEGSQLSGGKKKQA
ncbi:hypothetical protein CHS0354_003058 [Potamilus streckersoni]|uniref:Uncharacterized protein n=1 Tax=Potamilus streckersoni TaxID=2493646 RepID=A0AAE0TBL6_9BIVA|nr:hypothetical protein CHS0354_003058 [Potamilus streckersoni]